RHLIGFMDHLQACAPSRLLDVMDLTQVQNGALGRVTDAPSPVLDHAPIAMLFAVLSASVIAQKHIVGCQSITPAGWRGRGWVATCGIWKTQALAFNDLRQMHDEKKSKSTSNHEISANPLPTSWGEGIGRSHGSSVKMSPCCRKQDFIGDQDES